MLGRVLDRLLTRIAGADLADSILGDLEEGRIRRARQSRLRAGVWLFASAARVAGCIVVHRVASALISSARRGVMEPTGPRIPCGCRSSAR
jgi:hypothetical protein